MPMLLIHGIIGYKIIMNGFSLFVGETTPKEKGDEERQGF
jgi:hypothetical protein